MLAISRALMLRPKLLLLDEPSFGLAPKIVAEIFRILRGINAGPGQHAAGRAERHLALDLAHDAYLLETGRVAMSGPAKRSRTTRPSARPTWATETERSHGSLPAPDLRGPGQRRHLRLAWRWRW
jgi:ABC-type branched-subunit amino acid transport system ATPase component